jgi:(S)-sulfolactate dehydrogenase
VADVVITEFMDAAAVDWLKQRFVSTTTPGWSTTGPGCVAAGEEASRGLIVRNRTQVDAELLAAWPSLRRSAASASGSTTSTCRPASDRGIAVMPATGGNTVSVAEYVIATVLMLRRGAYHGPRQCSPASGRVSA